MSGFSYGEGCVSDDVSGRARGTPKLCPPPPPIIKGSGFSDLKY